MRASLLASATAATFLRGRASSARAQRESRSVLCLAWRNTVRAPWMRSVRRYVSPRLLIPNSRCLPPLECSRAASGRDSPPSSGHRHSVGHRPRRRPSRRPSGRPSPVGHRACGFVHPRHKPVAPVHHNRQSVRRAPATAGASQTEAPGRTRKNPAASSPNNILTKPRRTCPGPGAKTIPYSPNNPRI